MSEILKSSPVYFNQLLPMGTSYKPIVQIPHQVLTSTEDLLSMLILNTKIVNQLLIYDVWATVCLTSSEMSIGSVGCGTQPGGHDINSRKRRDQLTVVIVSQYV